MNTNLRRAVRISHDLSTPVEEWESAEGTIVATLEAAGLTADTAQGLTVDVTTRSPNQRAGGYDKNTDTVYIHPTYLADGYSLLHEIGHRDSAQRGLEHSLYFTSEQQETEEIYADDFAIAHGADPVAFARTRTAAVRS
jgi:hypothetical protein